MPLTMEVLETARYITSLKERLCQFFDYYLNEETEPPQVGGTAYSEWWSQVKGEHVSVRTARSPLRPTDRLTAPVLTIQKGTESITYSQLALAQYEQRGEWHQIAVRLEVLTDGETGREMAADDISSAINVILAEHRHELDRIGIRVVDISDMGELDIPGLYVNQHELQLEVLIQGPKERTIAVEMGFFQLTAAGVGVFSPGLTLELPHSLILETAYGTHPPGATVTVQALNVDGEPRLLSGFVPGATAARSSIALVGEVADDEYLQVTNMTVDGGTAGDRYRVLNIPKELED